MFQETWTVEDQQAVERLAKKFGVDLAAEPVAGENATFAQIEAAAADWGRPSPAKSRKTSPSNKPDCSTNHNLVPRVGNFAMLRSGNGK